MMLEVQHKAKDSGSPIGAHQWRAACPTQFVCVVGGGGVTRPHRFDPTQGQRRPVPFIPEISAWQAKQFHCPLLRLLWCLPLLLLLRGLLLLLLWFLVPLLLYCLLCCCCCCCWCRFSIWCCFGFCCCRCPGDTVCAFPGNPSTVALSACESTGPNGYAAHVRRLKGQGKREAPHAEGTPHGLGPAAQRNAPKMRHVKWCD